MSAKDPPDRDSRTPSSRAGTAATKRPYTSPRLRKLGNVTALTLGGFTKPSPDGNTTKKHGP